MKFVLTTGGKGTRVAELTDGVVPKGLSRLAPEVPRPLVAYQLDHIKKVGITSVYMSFDVDWQITLFKQSLRIREVPDLDYTFGIHQWKHPLNTFYNQKVLEFIGRDDFFWSYGDNFYSPGVLESLITKSQETNTSVGSQMHSDSPRWSYYDKFLTFRTDQTGKVLSYDYRDKRGFTIHAPFYFQNRALKTIKDELLNSPPRTLSLLKRLCDKNQFSIIKPEFLLNMNTSDDIQTMVKALRRYQKTSSQ